MAKHPNRRGKGPVPTRTAAATAHGQESGAESFLRNTARAEYRIAWELAAAGAPLTPEQEQKVAAMRDHPEYAELWPRLDELPDDFYQSQKTSPVLHITFHEIIENQLRQGDPPEARQTVDALMRAGVMRHDAIHRLAGVMANQIYRILQHSVEFDRVRYVRELQELREQAGA